MIQKFTIIGNPKGQGRPRITRQGNHVRVYEASKDLKNKETISSIVLTQHPCYINAGIPIALKLSCYYPRPKMHYDAKGQVKHRFIDRVPTVKPDVSNVLKAVEDALNGVLWADDVQIVKATVEKIYATQPHMTLGVIHEETTQWKNIYW